MAARAAYLAEHASTSTLNRPHGPANRPSRAARRHRTLARCDANVNDVSEQSSATPRSRSIVVMCHHVTPHARAGLFSPANLLQGRVDVWCRCVTAGLYLSDAIRTNSTVHLVLQSDDLASCRLVSVDGATVEGLAPRNEPSRCSYSAPCSTPRSTNSRRSRGRRRDADGRRRLRVSTTTTTQTMKGSRCATPSAGVADGSPGSPAAAGPCRGSRYPITTHWNGPWRGRCGAAGR